MEALFFQIVDLYEKGGFVMPPLALATLLLWFAIGHRYFTLRRGHRGSLNHLLHLAKSGRLMPQGVMDSAVFIGHQIREKSDKYLKYRLEEAFGDLGAELGQYRALIHAIVVVAPLTGLLGTVAGMIEVFDSLGDMALFSQSGGIAGGVSQALLTTQMGLAVAIPGTVVGRLLNQKQHRLEGELLELQELLLGRKDETA